MRTVSALFLAAAAAAAAGVLGLARADPTIAAWNDLLLDAIKAEKLDSNKATRIGAILHTAQWQAVQAAPNDPAAQAQAAAAAGKAALLPLLPAANASINALYEKQAGAGGAQGVAAAVNDQAASVAAALVAARANDGSNQSPPPYKGSEEVGKWRPTPPEFKPALTAYWGSVTPFNLKSGDQFRIPPPPALDSEAFKTAYLEVKDLGNKTSTVRTPEQTDTGLFWAAGVELLWFQVVKQATANLSLPDAAKAYAATATAMADARIATFNNKFFYNAWRPATSVPLGNGVGFPADPHFETLFPTPPHPEYPQGHTTTGEAVATVLRAINGGKDELAFSLTSDKLPGKTRTYTSFSQASQENREARTIAGEHFRFSGEASLPLGKQVGQTAVDAYGYAGAAPSSKKGKAKARALRREV